MDWLCNRSKIFWGVLAGAWLLAGLVVPLSAKPAAGPAWGDYIGRIPDNTKVRQGLANLLSDPIGQLSTKLNRDYAQVLNPEKVRFEVYIDSKRKTTTLMFKNLTEGGFPDTAPGNVAIVRRQSDGAIDVVKIFLSSDPAIYLRIESEATGSLMTVYFKDNSHPLFQELPLPLSLDRVAQSPIALLLQLTEAKVDWQLLLDVPDQAAFGAIPQLASQIRGQLKYLPDAEDGAMDETGHLVRIAGLPSNGLPGFNCSGFLKWIADGYYFPLTRERTGTGKYLSVAELKERQLDARGGPDTDAFEESRDPFFGLDWTRNIAAKLYEARTGRKAQNPREWDVRSIPYLNYVENRGYPVEWLRLALYLAALKEPGTIYLGAVNGDWGQRPVLLQYYHVVAFYPWIDAKGKFRCVVFERNLETSLDSLERRYPREFMHLVRLRGMKDFEPVRIQ